MDGSPPERIPFSPFTLCVLVGCGDDVVEVAVAILGKDLIHNRRSSPLEATHARGKNESKSKEWTGSQGEPMTTRTLHLTAAKVQCES